MTATVDELKATYGDPLIFYTVECHFEWRGENRWILHRTKIKTVDGAVHDVDWRDEGHTDVPHGEFIHDRWVDGQGDYYEPPEQAR